MTEPNQDFRKLTEMGVDDAPVKNVNWDVSQQSTRSETKLEDDEGYGSAAVIRQFTFKANPQTFRYSPPTKQELFNAHAKQIEIALWKDGLKILPEHDPGLHFNKAKTYYSITVGAIPARGNILPYDLKPMTLTEIAHGRTAKAK